MTAIKAGDLLYAAGPGHHLAQAPTDLRVYRTVVKNVRLEGSYSASATPADLASARYAIELNDDRPVLGFPKWTYSDHEVGINVHRSAVDALRAFAAQAQRRHDEAEQKRDHARREVQWATKQANALTETA